MWWRVPRSQWEQQKGQRNRAAFRKLVRSSSLPLGILAYDKKEPVGWCAVGPRESFLGLSRSRVLKPVDQQAVWSVTCLFVARAHRDRGVSAGLLRAAADFAARHGARLLEGYPVEARSGRMPDAFAWTGTTPAFRRAGFQEVLRRSPTRPIMRKKLRN